MLNIASEIAKLKSMELNNFAVKYAGSGIGDARFTCNQPCPRSMAKLTAKPNIDAPITPNVPIVASR